LRFVERASGMCDVKLYLVDAENIYVCIYLAQERERKRERERERERERGRMRGTSKLAGEKFRRRNSDMARASDGA